MDKLKLVRDKVPDLHDNPENVNFQRLASDSIFTALYERLYDDVEGFEETSEKAVAAEKAADVLEVLYAILEREGISLEDVERRRLEKLEKDGGFKEGMLMITTEEVDYENR